MAERLGRALQKLVQRFESARCLHVVLFLECFIPAHLLCSVSLVAISTEDAAFFHFDHDVWSRVSQPDCLRDAKVLRRWVDMVKLQHTNIILTADRARFIAQISKHIVAKFDAQSLAALLGTLLVGCLVLAIMFGVGGAALSFVALFALRMARTCRSVPHEKVAFWFMFATF